MVIAWFLIFSVRKYSTSGKAAGPIGVLVEMLKATGDVGLQWLTDLCNAIVLEGKIPDDWKESWMVSVYKGKGDALECGSYRGIKLLDHHHHHHHRLTSTLNVHSHERPPLHACTGWTVFPTIKLFHIDLFCAH